MVDDAPAVSRGIYHANFTARPDLKRHLASALAARGIDVEDLRLKAYSTRPLVKTSLLHLEGLALVGEAVGIDATTGEGIAQAVLMGGVAARHLARALRSGDVGLTEYDDAVRKGRVGRHLLQSAWLAKRVYGPRGRVWRAFLAGQPLAQEAGARWYAGRRLGWRTKARLALGLALAR